MFKPFASNFFLLALLSLLFPLPSLAQVVPDNTLGAESSEINSIDELRDAIEGGAIRGDNLFHSFQEFNVGERATVDFANPAGIENIFSRVTGGNISEIFGTLGVDGNANLFLINPNGIIFGENARLDVNGSFLATTAEDVDFGNGEVFSAANPNLPSLTINLPIGLGLGSNPGDIVVTGVENNVLVEIPSFKVLEKDYTSGLQVNSGNNISLIGGNISFDGGGLQAPGGDIQVVSADNNENVKLLPNEDWFKADLGNVSQFKDIELDNAAYISTSDNAAGNILLAGKNVILDRGSVVLANTSSTSNNSIDIYAKNLLEIKGSSGNNIINVSFDKNPNINFRSFQGKSNFYSVSLIGADLLAPSENQNSIGGDININAKNIRVLDAGEIRTISFSNLRGTAGNIKLDAQDIFVEGINADGLITSTINSSTGTNSNGNSGNLDISTSILRVENGGRVKADTFSTGNGGAIKIEAKQIFLNGKRNAASAPSRFRTGLSVSPGKNTGTGGNINIKTEELNIVNADITTSSFNEGGTGTPGNVTINTRELRIYDGGAIRTETAAGNAANIQIDAKNLELRGTRANFADFVGGISSATRLNSFGEGGDIEINTDSLKILDGSIIRAISLGSGDAGDILINAQKIEISGVDRFALDPVASERVSKINTGSLNTNGGNLTITSDLIKLDDFGKIQATSVEGNQGGNINLDTDSLKLFGQSNVTASAGGQGNGGNITIDTETLVGLQNSDITASAIAGNGGNIEITSDYIFGLNSTTELTPFSDITASSELGIDGTVTIFSPESNIGEEVIIVGRDERVFKDRDSIDNKCSSYGEQRVRVQDLGSPIAPSPFDFPYSEDLPSEQSPIANSSQVPDDEAIVQANTVKVLPDGRTFLVAKTKSNHPVAEPQLCTR